MKRGARFLVICLFASSALWAQSGQNSGHSAPQGQSGQRGEPAAPWSPAGAARRGIRPSHLHHH